MKVLHFVWRNPDGSLVQEQLKADDFRISTEPGFVKMKAADGDLLRIIPAHRVELLQWVEKEEPSPIINPADVMTGPRPT